MPVIASSNDHPQSPLLSWKTFSGSKNSQRKKLLLLITVRNLKQVIFFSSNSQTFRWWNTVFKDVCRYLFQTYYAVFMKSRGERKYTCDDEFNNTVVINMVIVFTSEYDLGFRFFSFIYYQEEKNLWNIYTFLGRFA